MNIFNISFFLNPSFKKLKSPSAKGKGLEIVLAPLTFASWNQVIQDMQNIYKLKELIGLPASNINTV